MAPHFLSRRESPIGFPPIGDLSFHDEPKSALPLTKCNYGAPARQEEKKKKALCEHCWPSPPSPTPSATAPCSATAASARPTRVSSPLNTYYAPTLCRYATNRLRSRSQAWRRHIVYKSTTLPYPAQLSKSTTLPYPAHSLAIRRIFYTQLSSAVKNDVSSSPSSAMLCKSSCLFTYVRYP